MKDVSSSIIIPTYNRADSLKFTLESISKQRSIGDLEVIVVDNGSTDSTKNVCTYYSSIIKKFKYYYDDIPGLLSGRHKGAELASGDVLTFIDDDVEVSDEWAINIQNIFQKNPDIQFVTGPCLPKYQVYPPEWINYFWWETPYGGKMCPWLSLLDLGDKEMIVDASYVFGLNYSIRRKALFELGGFHPDCIPSNLQQYQGDGETGLSYKANMLGYKAFYSPAAMLYHQISKERLTVEYFEKRSFYNGVCESFTAIRKENKLYSSLDGQHENIEEVKRSHFKNVVYRIKNKIRNKIKPEKYEEEPMDIQSLRRRLHLKHIEGYDFHQHAYQRDEAVREWVLKVNYWDYKLPV